MHAQICVSKLGLVLHHIFAEVLHWLDAGFPRQCVVNSDTSFPSMAESVDLVPLKR